MLHPKRRAIAYIAGRLITGKSFQQIYDFLYSSSFNYSGTISAKVSVFDHSRSSYLAGTKTSIFDYGTGKHISLEIDENEF